MSGMEWTMTVTLVPRSAKQRRSSGRCRSKVPRWNERWSVTHTHTTNEWQIGNPKGLRVEALETAYQHVIEDDANIVHCKLIERKPDKSMT